MFKGQRTKLKSHVTQITDSHTRWGERGTRVPLALLEQYIYMYTDIFTLVISANLGQLRRGLRFSNFVVM